MKLKKTWVASRFFDEIKNMVDQKKTVSKVNFSWFQASFELYQMK